MHIPVTPTLAADGGGRIGVSLAANARVVRRAAAGPVQALRAAGAEFSRLAGIVTGGEFWYPFVYLSQGESQLASLSAHISWLWGCKGMRLSSCDWDLETTD